MGSASGWPIASRRLPPTLTALKERLTALRRRNHLVYALLIALVMMAGLASRKFDRFLPGVLHKNTGDALWATLVFFLIGFLFPRLSTLRVGALAALFSLGIEVGKFYYAPWLDSVRATVLGRLVFGYVFSWSNLVCYLVGIGLGVLLEMCRIRKLT